MHVELAEQTEPPPTKVEGFSGLEFLRRTVGPFRTAVGGLKPDFCKMNCLYEWLRAKLCLLGGWGDYAWHGYKTGMSAIRLIITPKGSL